LKVLFLVAKSEFATIIRNNIVTVFVGFILMLAVVNSAGFSVMQDMYGSHTHDSGFYIGISNLFYDLSTYFSFLAMCVGVISIAEERSRGSLRVLFTKPLYRRDVIAGKFLGISMFLLLIIALTITLFVSIEMIFYGGPSSLFDLFFRIGTYVVMSFLNSCFTLGLVMLFGILMDMGEALVISVAFIIYEWLAQMGTITTALTLISPLKDVALIDPAVLYLKVFLPVRGGDHALFAIGQPYVVWLQNAYPYLLLMVLELVLIILVDCALFSREEA
jgi:ABC-2 type transport system permease protein